MTDFKTNLKNLQSSLANDSARTKDDNGYLFVENNNISKADVNPYYGSDIPNYQSLGLIPDKVYHLYRDPLELAKAVDSFKGKPLLRGHHNIHAGDIPRDMVIGSIGTDVRFEHPFLVASLSIWDEKDIAMVEADKVKELSSSYFYTPDMTSGEVNGVRYDGVMRDIVGNHVAIVEQGRAGSQVAVADSKLQTKGTVMSKFQKMIDLLRPHLARDAKDEDIEEALKKADDKAKDEDKEDDKAEDACGRDEDKDKAKDKAKDEDKKEDDKDAKYDDRIEKLKKELADARAEIDDYKEKERGAEDKAKDKAKDRAKDEDGDDKEERRKADDAAMIEQRVIARLKLVEQAKNAVRPFVGNLAMDSADDIYAVGLKHLGMNLNGLPKSGYQAMFEALANKERAKLANDSAFQEQGSLADTMKLKRI